MPWIESHTVLIRHKKIVEVARQLRLRRSYVLGHLHALWHAALDQREDGDISSWSDEFIAEQADYPGDAPQFVRLLQEKGLLDGKLIHDWLDYAGRYLEAKYRTSNPNKLLQIWQKHGLTYSQSKVSLKSDERRSKDRPPDQPTNQPPKPTITHQSANGGAENSLGGDGGGFGTEAASVLKQNLLSAIEMNSKDRKHIIERRDISPANLRAVIKEFQADSATKDIGARLVTRLCRRVGAA